MENLGTIIVIAILAIIVFSVIGIYNGLVRKRANRENAFADVDVQLRQRHDLIPQLVSAVKGYMNHESETYEKVVKARAGAVNASTIEEKIVKENDLSSAMRGLNIAVEAYPDLKASQNFLNLQEEMSDIENKLSAARRFFNSSTRELNVGVQSFPANLLAGMFGFKIEKMFEIDESDRAAHEAAPVVQF